MPRSWQQTLDRVGVENTDRYKVIMHNDDFTTMDLVVLILLKIFFYNPADARAIMMKIHTEGSAVVGTYSYDVAVSKARKAIRMARDKGYPLNLTVEPADSDY